MIPSLLLYCRVACLVAGVLFGGTIGGAHAAVAIVNQPQSTAVIAGDRAVFTVLATGTGTLSYQWKKNAAPITGATSSALILNPAAFTDAASYTVDVTDADPSTVTSSAANLLVNSAKGGDVDFSFAAGSSFNFGINAAAVQSDGKILIAGGFTTIKGAVRGRVARLNSDGTTDFSFGNGLAGANLVVYAMALQSDGKVLIGGNFTAVNGAPRFGIARLNSDGTLDTGFGNGLSGISGDVYAMAVQGDGRIIVGGTFSSVNGSPRNNVARLNSDGTLDTSFGNGLAGAGLASVGSSVSAIAVQSDGKVIIGGQFNTVNGVTRNCIARLNNDGTLDTGFGNGLTGANNNVGGVAIQNDGRILIGGAFTSTNGTTRGRVARLNSDGTLDTSFANGLAGTNNDVDAVALQSDGKVLIAGLFRTVNGTALSGIARLNSDGTLDTAFANGQYATGSTASVLAIQGDGKIVAGSGFSTATGTALNAVVRINSDGTLDAGFQNGVTGISGAVTDLAVQGDGKVVVGVTNGSINGALGQRVGRFNPDGTLDTSFGNGLTVNDSVFAVALQNDGKVLIGGTFTNINAWGRNGIARLNSDGTFDIFGFGYELSGASNVDAIAVQGDGKVLIGGGFSSVNGAARGNIARLNSDGTLDTSFGNGFAGANGFIDALAIQSDGKVLIGGNFTSVNGTARNNLARLNSDGTLDTTFGAGLTGTVVATVAQQSDGKVLVVGQFTSANGVTRNNIARFNADGTLDAGFGNGLGGANGAIYVAAVQADGRVLVGGAFTSINGTARGKLARLNSDGTLDSTFGNGLTGAANDNGNVTALAIQGDGKVLIGGGFGTFNGMAESCLARLQYSKVDADLTALAPGVGALSPVFNPGSIAYAETVSGATGSITVTPTSSDPAATIAVSMNGGNYSPVASGSASGALALNVGANSVAVQVTSADGTVVKTYSINVNVTPLTAQESWRLTYFGTTSNTGAAAGTADPDGDGQNNLFEFVAGLAPTDPTSRFSVRLAPVPGQQGQMTIIFGPIVGGRTYIVNYKTNPADPSWTTLTNIATTDNGSERTVTDLSAATGARYYQVEITLP